MGVHSRISNDASVGTTIGTFDAIDTRNSDNRLRDGTTAVVGLSVGLAPAAQTTGTAVMGRLRFNSSDMGIANETFALGATAGGGIATQSSAWGIPAEWIPVDWPAGPGNVTNLSYSQAGIEPADNWAIQVGVHHVAGVAPPAPWFVASMCRATMPFQGGISSNGGSTTTARTSMTSATISSRFRQLVGFRGVNAQDAVPSNAEADVAFFEITSTIGDFDPMEYPSSTVGPALVGTLVGGGVHVFQPWLPMYATKGPATETVEPFVTGLVTLTAANAYGWGIGLRF